MSQNQEKMAELSKGVSVNQINNGLIQLDLVKENGSLVRHIASLRLGDSLVTIVFRSLF